MDGLVDPVLGVGVAEGLGDVGQVEQRLRRHRVQGVEHRRELAPAVRQVVADDQDALVLDAEHQLVELELE